MNVNIKVSRLLSLVLRHKPETIGIELDKNGWVSITELLEALEKNGTTLTFDELNFIVDSNDKKRFGFNEDVSKIRANQGHSLSVDLQLKAVRPPSLLYHGTSYDNSLLIKKEGIKKMNRNHVHLSEDSLTAEKVGSRKKGLCVILNIDSQHMNADGVKFYKSDNGVWLTDYVAPIYIK